MKGNEEDFKETTEGIFSGPFGRGLKVGLGVGVLGGFFGGIFSQACRPDKTAPDVLIEEHRSQIHALDLH